MSYFSKHQTICIGRKCQSGQSLVEFALVLPLLIFLFSALCDAGRLVVITHRFDAATREGAKLATETTTPVINPTNGNPIAANITQLENAAVARVRRILIDSGVPAYTSGGELLAGDLQAQICTETKNGVRYWLMRVGGGWDVPTLFGLFGPTLRISSLAWGYVTEYDASTGGAGTDCSSLAAFN